MPPRKLVKSSKTAAAKPLTKAQEKMARLVSKPRKQPDSEDESDVDELDEQEQEQEQPEPTPEPEPELEPDRHLQADEGPVPEPLKPKLVRQSRKKNIMPSMSDDDEEVVLEVKKKAPRKPRATKKQPTAPAAGLPATTDVPNPSQALPPAVPPPPEPKTETKPEPKPEPVVEIKPDPRQNFYEEEMRKFRESMESMNKDFQRQLAEEKARLKEQHEREKAELAREKAELSNMRAIKYQSLLKF